MITIGVPTYNRSEVIKKTLLVFQSLNLPSCDFELIVVDNNSSDNTRQICEEFLPTNGRYVLEVKQGVSHARNRVFEEAQGDIVAFTDDDGSPDKDWLLEIEKLAQIYPDSGLFMGRTINEWEVDPPAWYQEDPMHKVIFNYNFDMGNEICEIPLGCYPSGPNMAVRHSVYEKIGGFDPKFGIIGGKKIGGEEIDFAWRARRAGFNGYYSPSLIVYHRTHAPLIKVKSLFKNSLAAGYSDSFLLKKYPEHYSSENASKISGMPLWWWRSLLVTPFKNLFHLCFHVLENNKTASVHHLLAIFRWFGRMRFIFNGCK